ncbi:MAG: F0F1 ATP synthase subunit B [Bacteroidales bacterium]
MGLVTPDFGLLFWMLLTFLIVLFVLKKFAWKPILNSLKEREESIEEALEMAKKTKEEMAKLQADNELVLSEARKQREEMIKEARDIRQKLIDEAKEKAKEEGEKVIASARQAFENEKATAIEDLKKAVIEMSVQIAEKILKKKLEDPKLQQEYLDAYLKDLKLN